MYRSLIHLVLLPVSLLMLGVVTQQAQALEEVKPATEYGEDLDLIAVLETFKESKDVEDFEKRLNDPDAEIVNLDLNGDEEVDFVSVHEEADGDVHVLILRVSISETESQDVGSIELEKKGEDVTVQIVGDPTIFGPDYIVEPEDTKSAALLIESPAEPTLVATIDSDWSRFGVEPDGYDEASFELATVIVVQTWPAVRVIYSSGYVVYVSPYRWHTYPRYYRVRRPIPRSRYRTRHVRHHNNYRRTTHRSSARASNVYSSRKVSSPSVTKKASPSSAAGPSSGTSKTGPGSGPSKTGPSTGPSKAPSAVSPRKSPAPSQRQRRGGGGRAPRRR